MNDEKIEEKEENIEEKPEEIPAIVSLKNILEKRAQQQEEEEKRKKEEQELKGLLEQITRIIDENVVKQETSEIEMVEIELANGIVLIQRKNSWSFKEDFTDNTEKPIKIGDLIVTPYLNEILRALQEEKTLKLEIIKRTRKGIEVECRLPY